MIKNNLLAELSKNFALRIIKLHKFLREERQEYVISTQVYKSGTSIGANIREAEHGESSEDFKHKLKIALKEANESLYWLEILYQAEYMDTSQYESMKSDCIELNKLLISIINTINKNIN